MEDLVAKGEDAVSKASDVAAAVGSAGSEAVTAMGSLGVGKAMKENDLTGIGSDVVNATEELASLGKKDTIATGQAAAKVSSPGEQGAATAGDTLLRAAASGTDSVVTAGGKALEAAKRTASAGKGGAAADGETVLDAGGKAVGGTVERAKSAWRAFTNFFKRLFGMQLSATPRVRRRELSNDKVAEQMNGDGAEQRTHKVKT
ncbi:conserved hypothetical protein [Neospora caninum Liverpool]|uniref:Uncharacterized protein n=1 Tax=Neospora caninum (strain Liverpool) TaxID=572307 RepID=F0VLK4_NEOCL|nr:conserved hypothetical protein [Neospora caninum Liverpool]CBZ54132.1 conserved hypothetical protein [Neospora caninum Liverpool]CEL68831.1 TPA: hypothetical protein BN1204_045640 [Neospora caninum Liverpool]|eukprot:XP_003884163.1 conserved hypothetical protein [Neospora caninum Liverpool]